MNMMMAVLYVCAGAGVAAAPPHAEEGPLSRHPAYEARGERVPDFASMVTIRAPEEPEVVARLERVSTVVPWPRGLAFVDGDLIALARGRHRSGGGVPDDFDDLAGTLFRIDPSIAEPVEPGVPAGESVRSNGEVFAAPTSPPFFPFSFDRAAEEDRLMDRPYCGLAFDARSRNLVVCSFAGAELDGGRRFRKHATDALHRFDLRDRTWRVLEQHDHTVVPEEALGSVISNTYYPHHDPARHDPPHGWLNGPTGCAVVGDFLYATSKDNHLVVQYDLTEIRRRPDAPPPGGRPVLGPFVMLDLPDGPRETEVLGAAAVSAFGGHLYIGYRTSSVVIRVPIDDRGDLVSGAPAELIAIFEPWSIESGRSGDMFDMTFNSRGDLFVAMAREGRVWRVQPDPARVFYGNDRSGRPLSAPPFIDIGPMTGQRGGAGNLAVDDHDRLYVCTRNDDAEQGVLVGTIYRTATRP